MKVSHPRAIQPETTADQTSAVVAPGLFPMMGSIHGLSLRWIDCCWINIGPLVCHSEKTSGSVLDC
eukprot:5784988-Heterocapsa_arctica.AAC.1